MHWTEGRLPAQPIPWELKRERLDYGFTELEKAGYTVVNGYAAVKSPKRHKFAYQNHLWRGGDMLGLGVASFGYFGGVHYQNTATLDSYQSGVKGGAPPVDRAFALSSEERMIREFILQLKFGEVSIRSFQEKFGVDLIQLFQEPLHELQDNGLACISSSHIRLTRDGLLRVDRLLPLFYTETYRGARYT